MSSSATDLAPHHSNPVATLAEGLLRIAADPSVDPARIRELYAIHREMQADQAKAAFAAALRLMQAEMQTQITAMTADLRTRLEVIDGLREELMDWEMRQDRRGAAVVNRVNQQMGWTT